MATSTQDITIKIKLLEEPEERYSTNEPFHNVMAIDDNDNIHEVKIWKDGCIRKFAKGAFLELRRFTNCRDGGIGVNKYTKITRTGNNAFAVEKEKERHFHEPEVVPLADLEHSLRKRRVSVVGRIDKVSQEQQTTNKTRKRDLVLTDGVRSVQMNLWGKQCDMQVTEGARVKIGPVIVDQYKETNNINSTLSTKIQVIEEADIPEENGTLQGIDTDEKCLLIDGVHMPYRGDIMTLGSEDYIISKLPF